MEVKKGIVFRRNGKEREVQIHKQSLKAYLDSLPEDEKGWCLFNFKPLDGKLSRKFFAQIEPK